MPRDNRAPLVKLYYRIGEVAALVGVEPHVLRYWESEFPTIRPQKSRSGQRVYSRRDVDKLLRVKDLLYAQRFTIAGARQRLRGPALEAQASDEPLAESELTPELAPEQAEQSLEVRERERGTDEPPRAPAGAATALVHTVPAPITPAHVTPTPSEGTRAAAAMALRAALLAVREQVMILLDRVDGGANGSDP